MQEIWKPIVGYEGLYEVSNLGRVRSIDRVIFVNNKKRKLTGKLLELKCNRGGYLICVLSNKKTKSIRVHRVVAESFIPKIKGKLCINHLDNDRTNNNVSNLQWCTQKENIRYAYSQNRMDWERIKGEKHPQSKLNISLVKEIRNKQGILKRIDVARLYKIDPANVSSIWNRKTWKHC